MNLRSAVTLTHAAAVRSLRAIADPESQASTDGTSNKGPESVPCTSAFGKHWAKVAFSVVGFNMHHDLPKGTWSVVFHTIFVCLFCGKIYII